VTGLVAPRVALGCLLVLLGPVLVGTTEAAPTAQSAPPAPPPVREIRSILTAESGAARPTGLAAPEDGTLLVAHRVGQETALLQMTSGEDPVATSDLPRVTQPATLAYDPAGDRLTAMSGDDLLSVDAADLGSTQPDVQRDDAAVLGLDDPQGATFDPATGTELILDNADRTIVRAPMAAGAPRSPSHISLRDLRDLRGRRLQGLALNPRDGLLYVASPDAGLLYGVDRSGALRTTYSLRSLGLKDLRAMVFAPSADRTDDPAAVSLYMADAGDTATLGRVMETTLAAAAATTAPTVSGSLVQTIQLSQLDPPGPDAAGITYLPGPDRLEVSDSEVEEMPIFQGVNLFQLTRTGQLTNTGVTTAFSNEPTGLGFDPASGTLFVSDDNANRINMIRPGADGRYGTADDQRSNLSTIAFGSDDPEGCEFDPSSGHLFVADGVNREVYDVNPVNGTFGDGNDVVTHFDLEQHGVVDPEGIGADTSRDTLVVVDRAGRKIYEVDKSGALLQIVTFAAASPKNPAGLTVAPTSNNPGRASYWVAERGVDNNTDPDENDGKVYEIAAPASSDNPPSVAITSPPSGATVAGTLNLAANASDDQGVAQVQFRADGAGIGTDADGSNGWSAVWDTTSATDGTHTLTAVATDTGSNTTTSAAVSVTVANSGPVATQDVSIAAGLDDVEERSNGRMWVATSDLDLVTDGPDVQTVGMRFTGIQVPQGATVANAYVQFQTDEATSGATSLTVRAQAADNAPPFTTTRFDLSSRPRTGASTGWTPPPWPQVGARGVDQRTPDLSAVVQEVVNRPGWTSGSAVALVITGSGSRVAESFEGTFAPVLHLELTTG
jgi:uncharacterized protein YjiK